MPTRLERAELWDDFKCAGGSPQAVLPLVRCRMLEQIEDRVATTKLSQLTFARDWDQTGLLGALFVPTSVIRLARVGGAFHEFRLVQTADSSGDGNPHRVEGLGPIFDLGRKEQLISETVNGVVSYSLKRRDTVANLLTELLNFAPSYWDLGTVTPSSTVVDVEWVNATVLAAAIVVITAAARVTGTIYELSDRQNGVAGYYLDATVLNSAAIAPDIRTKKNLRTVERIRDGREQATRVVWIGLEGKGVGDNWWKVTAVTVDTSIRVQDINGGPSPLIEADALNTAFYVVDDANVKHQITDSTVIDPQTAEFAMASTTNIAVGDWVRIARNSAGDEVQYLDKPSTIADYGILLVPITRQFPAWTNWVKNGDLADWSGALPADWSIAGTNPTKTTTSGLWLTGGQSALLDDASTSFYQDRTIYFPVTGLVTYTVWIQIKAFSTDAASQVRFKNPQTGADDIYLLDGTVGGLDQLDVWVAFSRSYPITSVGAKAIQVLVGNGQQPAQFYFDAGQFTFTPHPVPFVRHSGGATGWLDAIAYLNQHATPPVSYRGRIRDLTRLDPTRWPYDELLLGGTTTVTDHELNAVFTPRLVGLDRNELDPADTEPTWSTRRPEVGKELAAAVNVIAASGGGGSPLTPPPVAPPPISPLAPNQVTDLLEVSSTVNLFRAGDTNHSFNPVAFNWVHKQYGTRIRLNANGSISITSPTPGLYAIELGATPATQSPFPDYFAILMQADATTGPNDWPPFLYDDAWRVNDDAGAAEISERSFYLSGTLQAAATDTITFKIVAERSPSGDMLIRDVFAKVRYIGPLPAGAPSKGLVLTGVAATPGVGNFTVVIS